MKYVILTEKPSAMANFAKALGGKIGTFNGDMFQIVSLRGHVMSLPNKVSELVDPAHKERFDSWDPDFLPWDVSLIKWAKTPIRAKNPRTGKIETTQGLLNNLKQASADADAIVIATDTDPSGEGELLAWEAINAIGWHKKVFRENHTDESEAGIKKAMSNLRDVSNQARDGEYVKAEGRNYWDYLSMQLTRVATTSARRAGYDIVARQGRLKSVIVYHIFEQLEAIKNYKKKPYYEVQFKDENSHVYSRKFDEAVDAWRFEKELDAKNDLSKYQKANVGNVKHENKTQAPGKLLDLSGLTSLLTPKGFSSKEIQSTYQKMYESQVVSYPRTEDKVVTQEQFNELLPLIDKIADVVGVDKSLLTHRTPRGKHVGNGAHGANRPGLKVPTSLQALSAFGPSAQAIYETLAKNYLSILGEDYEFVRVTANLVEYPEFKTSFSIPKKLNYKAIFDSSSARDKDDDDEEEDSQLDVGQMATPQIKTGANKKPAAPTVKWLMTYLEKQDVGTGATRVSTLAEISSGKSALLKENRGKLTLTGSGNVSGALAKGTMIASPKATKQLFDMMDKVGTFQLDQTKLIASATQLIEHDKPVIMSNAAQLKKIIGEPDASIAVKVPKPKAKGVWNGREISFSKEWGGHSFTDNEVAQLLSGKTITIDAVSKAGKPYKVVGALAEGTFNGNTFIGFKPDFNAVDKNDPYLFNGKSWNHSFSGHDFTPDEMKKLAAGETIEITATSKAGKEYTVSGQLEETEWNNRKFVKFSPNFNKK